MTYGYWSPHSSSVDFCEPNYLITPYIAEFHNSWSSALITVLSLIALCYGNPTKEFRFTMMFLIMGSVGVGSVGLHTTLHWLPQSSDELPMLWASLSMLYALCVMREPKDSPKVKTYGAVFLAIGFAESVIYYSFRQIYAVFIVSIIASSIVVISWMTQLTFFDKDLQHSRIRQILFYLAAYVFSAGFGLWLIDMNLCEYLMPVYLRIGGFTLHVFWHMFSCLGTYIAYLHLISVRLQFLKLEPQIKFVFGFFPVIKVRPQQKRL